MLQRVGPTVTNEMIAVGMKAYGDVLRTDGINGPVAARLAAAYLAMRALEPPEVDMPAVLLGNAPTELELRVAKAAYEGARELGHSFAWDEVTKGPNGAHIIETWVARARAALRALGEPSFYRFPTDSLSVDTRKGERRNGLRRATDKTTSHPFGCRRSRERRSPGNDAAGPQNTWKDR